MLGSFSSLQRFLVTPIRSVNLTDVRPPTALRRQAWLTCRNQRNQIQGGIIMEARINYAKVVPAAFEAMLGYSNYVHKSGLEENLLNLVFLRASQLNRCAYCIDMHWKDLRAAGEQEQRLYGLDAWEESPYYSDRERAALAWTESVTNIQEGHVPDEVYEKVRKAFTEKEMVNLTVAITVINSWNRLNIAARTVPGSYQPAKAREMKRGA
jgi:AhpD family alkylhydroperoxidase